MLLVWFMVLMIIIVKEEFEGQLTDIRRLLNMPMLMMGDFNEVLKPKDRKGGTMFSKNMLDFGE